MIDIAERHLLAIGGTGTIGSAVTAMALGKGAMVTATGRSVDDVDPGDASVGWRRAEADDVERALDALGGVTDIVLAAAARPFDPLVDMSDET